MAGVGGGSLTNLHQPLRCLLMTKTRGHNVRKELEKLAQDIDSVKPHPRNVRQGDIGTISRSLEANGQYRPIVVHKPTNHILAGNHTWKAAKALGWTKIAVTYVDCNEEDAIRILLADNKANDLATYDDQALLELLKHMIVNDTLDGTLYEPSDLDDLIALLEPPNLEQVIADIGAPEDDDFTGTIKVKVTLPTYERWQEMWAALEGDTDDERIANLIDAYGSHA